MPLVFLLAFPLLSFVLDEPRFHLRVEAVERFGNDYLCSRGSRRLDGRLDFGKRLTLWRRWMNVDPLWDAVRPSRKFKGDDRFSGIFLRPVAAWWIGHCEPVANLGEAVASDAEFGPEAVHRRLPDEGVEFVSGDAARLDTPLFIHFFTFV